jgi:hypothetical protein
MGFNIQQYELNNNEEFSNGSGWLKEKVQNFGEKLGIGDGKVLGIGQGNVKASLGIGDGKVLGIGQGNVKKFFGIGDGKIFGKVVNPTKNAEYNANKYVTSGQKEIDDKKAKLEDEKQTDTTTDTTKTGVTPKKSNTVLYASIGGAVLILGIVGYFVFRKK